MEVREMFGFTIEGPPMGKQRHRVSRGRMYTPRPTAEYEAKVEEACMAEMKRRDMVMYSPGEPLGIQVLAYYPIPKSWSKKKQMQAVMGLIAPTTKPDADNVLKIVMDGLNGIIYEDDKQIVFAEVKKIYSTEPCVEVGIWREI